MPDHSSLKAGDVVTCRGQIVDVLPSSVGCALIVHFEGNHRENTSFVREAAILSTPSDADERKGVGFAPDAVDDMIAQLRQVLDRVEHQLTCSDRYACDIGGGNGKLATDVWHIQNGHVRSYVTEARSLLSRIEG